MTKRNKNSQNNKDRPWAEAKRKCRLNAQDVRMAKEMGLNPRSLIKNIPAKTEPWKLPVKDWIWEMYLKRQKKSAKKKARKGQAAVNSPASDAKKLPKDEIACLEYDESIFDADDYFLDQQEIQEVNHEMLRRQEQFSIAAKYVADCLSGIPEVQKVVLFGSVAKPLNKEVPRFHKFRRAGIATYHECRDIDMAVWIFDLSHLKAIQRARSQALNDLLAEKQIGVAHHQVDIFVMEPISDRYLGRLCIFGSCPKGKDECRISGCGEPMFLQQLEDFKFETKNLNEDASVVLFERCMETR